MFTEFQMFEPYLSKEGMKQLITLYKTIISHEVSLQRKMEHYNVFNEEIEKNRNNPTVSKKSCSKNV